jgi:hypothetical protein
VAPVAKRLLQSQQLGYVGPQSLVNARRGAHRARNSGATTTPQGERPIIATLSMSRAVQFSIFNLRRPSFSTSLPLHFHFNISWRAALSGLAVVYHLRLHTADWGALDPANDYSYTHGNSGVTVYAGGTQYLAAVPGNVFPPTARQSATVSTGEVQVAYLC